MATHQPRARSKDRVRAGRSGMPCGSDKTRAGLARRRGWRERNDLVNLGAALMALLVALILKVAVMVLGGWLLLKVFRSTYGAPPKKPWLLLPPERAPGVRLIFWALVFFYVSELTCGIEIYVIFRSSPWLSGTHAFASAAGMALFALGLWRHLDHRVVRFGRPACAMNRICRGCTVATRAGCRFHTTFLLIGALVVMAGFPPLLAPVDEMVADPRRWLLPFPAVNRWYDGVLQPWLQARFPGVDMTGGAYYIREIVNVIEYRVLPLVALALSVAGVILLARDRGSARRRGEPLVVAAIGVLSYVYLELVTFRVHGDVLAGGVMHELLEFWFLVATAEYLSRAFGRGDVAPAAA
jgi:hypothetical protein